MTHLPRFPDGIDHPVELGCGTFVSCTYVNAPPHPLTSIAPQDVEVFVSGPPRRDHVDVLIASCIVYTGRTSVQSRTTLSRATRAPRRLARDARGWR